MAKVNYQQRKIDVHQNDSVLTALLEQGIEIPYGCRAGICQACLMQCTAGNILPAAQQGLTQQQKEDGYFLACSCFPQSDITIRRPDIACRYESTVVDVEQLTAQVLRLRLTSPIPFQPGQSLLVSINGTQRRFSIASSPPMQAYIELHIECRPSGLFCHQAQKLNQGDKVKVSSANGDCIYQSSSPEQSLLLVGSLTGLAPLIGLIQKALAFGHKGDINLIHICENNQFYYQQELRNLALKHQNLNIHRLTASDMITADFSSLLKESWSQLQQHQLYFAGSKGLIKQLARQAFLQGAKQQQLHIEPFTAS
ncbi:2Fe-2S iron-sulfur cluster-binding protein [Ferrimonas lipolytica]|uniref:2Fe-2S iron-sulfur cluster binding domain-containing protein n=1 Tax=Ferrimonas lipolytica TaxID=2724191 RepID=A0A6H1UCA6_9GAMM|nr:2Fe-2S iron-sulfur cluster-binding protein [Ferrimonas lipolytica]QIZ75442.1 2Fe-2S iron-sulfur cluster binding domain-containing protein [Ferrimonas lipolytica]